MAVSPQPPQNYTFIQCEREGIIGVSRNSLPTEEELLEAEIIYYDIMSECEQAGISLPPHNAWSAFANADADTWLAEEKQKYQIRAMNNPWNAGPDQSFSFPTWLDTNDSYGDRGLHKFFRCLYEYCPEAGRTNVLRLVLFALFFELDSRAVTPRPLLHVIPLARVWSRYTVGDKQKGYRILQNLAKDILTSFFLPFRTRREHTQIPLYRILVTPHTGAGPQQGCRWSLAALCFERDGARCVITGKYHRDWALGKPQQSSIFGMTETDVAYIIPHTLNDMDPDGNVVRCIFLRAPTRKQLIKKKSLD